MPIDWVSQARWENIWVSFMAHRPHCALSVHYVLESNISCPALSLNLQIHNVQRIVTRFKVRGFWSNTKKSAVWIVNNYYNKVYPDIFLPPASTKIKSHQMDVTWFLMTLTKQCCPFCKLKFFNLSKPQSIVRVKCFKRGSYSKSESLTMPMITYNHRLLPLTVIIWKSCMWTADKDVNMKAIFTIMNTTW